MAVTDVYKSNIFFDLQGQPDNILTYYFRQSGDVTSGFVEDSIIDGIETDLLPALAVVLNEELVFGCIEVAKLFDGAGNVVMPSIPRHKTIDIEGAISLTESLPGQCSLVVQTLPGLDDTNPRHRGRDFYTGFSEGDQADGVWLEATANALVAALQSALSPVLQGSADGEYQWVNWSPTIAAEAAPAIRPDSVITHVRPLRLVRTQRRRQPENPCALYYNVLTL